MIDTAKFEFVEKDSDVATYKHKVKTPMPENEDGSGYTTEENRQWAYRTGPHWLKVSKVGNHGWSIWHYKESSDGGGLERVGSLGRKENCQEAQRTALHTAEALA